MAMKVLLGLLPLLALTSCSLVVTPPPKQPHPLDLGQSSNGSVPVLVFSHGYHTGITVPAAALEHDLPGLVDDAPYAEFGWGDEKFYRAEGNSIRTLDALAAFLWPTPGVIHVVAVRETPSIYYQYSPVRQINLTPAESRSFVRAIVSSFAADGQGNRIDLGPGRYGESRFYRSSRRFFFPRSCNSWTAEMLRAGGREIRGFTAPGVFRSLDAGSTD